MKCLIKATICIFMLPIPNFCNKVMLVELFYTMIVIFGKKCFLNYLGIFSAKIVLTVNVQLAISA